MHGEARQSPAAIPYKVLSVQLDQDDSFDGLLSDFGLRDDSRRHQSRESAQQRFTSLGHDDHLGGDHDTQNTAFSIVPGAKPSQSVWSESVDTSSVAGNEHLRQADRHSQKSIVDETKLRPSGLSRQYWNPIWLRKYTLVAISGLFASLAAALVVLWFLNKRQNGFTTILGTNHYAWTYGPTAILVVVLSLWRQVEYHCKTLQPWRELSKGFVEAERSMLLDYLSPLQITSFSRAIGYRHIPVAASIAGFAVLKAVVLVSTGLLVLTPVKVTEPQSITITAAFDSQPFWDTIPGAPYAWDRSGPDSRMLYSNVSAHPIPSYLNTFREGAVPSANMAGSTVFQSIDRLGGTGLLSITVEVDAFVPNMTCENAQADLSMRSQYANPAAQLKSATCSEPGGHMFDNSYLLSCPDCPDAISYNIWRVNCSQGPIADNSSTRPLRYVDEHSLDDMRFAILVSNLTLEQHNISGNMLTAAKPQATAAVICKADYTMYKSLVTRNLTSGTNRVITTEPMPHLSNLTGLMLGEIFYSALANSKYLAGDLIEPEYMPIMSSIAPRVPFYNIMLQSMAGEQSIDRLLSAETLLSSAEQTLSGVAAHIIQESFLRPSMSQRNGTVLRSEERLEIGDASLWVMVAGFVIMIILTSSVMYTTSQSVAPRDPGLLSTDAMVLVSDPDLRKLLAPCNAMRTEEVADTLRGIKFGTSIGHNTFQIMSALGGSGEVFGKPKSKTKPWVPLSAKSWAACSTLVIPLAAIVTTEVIYRVSKDDGGFRIDVGSEDRATFVSRYLSALIVLLIATCYNNLDFTVSSFAPYSSLRWGPVPASRSIDSRILGAIPPVAFFRSANGRHIGPSLSNIAGMIGSVLTIVASGLWVINRNLAVEQNIAASLANGWDYEWHDSYNSGDGGAGIVLDQLQHGSAIMPDTIWDNVVLPHIEDIRSTSDSPIVQSRGSTLMQNHTLLVKGLRPLLSCEAVKDEYISILPTRDLQALAPLPPNCHYGGPNGSNSYYNFTRALSDGYTGSIYDLRLAPTGNLDLSYNKGQPDNPVGCPSIGAALVKSYKNGTIPDQVTVLLCSQRIQQLTVNATYHGPSLQHPKISADPAPVVVERSAQNLTNGTIGFDTFPYRIESYLENNLTSYPGSQLGSVDMFTVHLVYGLNGTALDNMIGKANQQNYIQAVQALYAKYMSLVIDMRFRVPVSAETKADPQQDSGPVEGTSYSFSSRLHLNMASKLTIQIMLGAMFVLGACTYLLTDLRGTLPREPYTIASKMAFLAGSDVCDGEQSHLPPDALWKSQKELDEVLDGWLFSLGWWQRSGSTASENAEAAAESSRGSSDREKKQGSKRFGIDVGVPEQLGFRETKWSSLRQRLGAAKRVRSTSLE